MKVDRSNIFLTMCLILIITHTSWGQQTMGVDIYNREATSDGYIFFSPNDYTDAYLIDNCGALVNSWDRNAEPGLSGYLTPTGEMLRTNKVAAPQFFQASTGGNLELVDWDNNTIWSSDFNTFEYIQHHDAVLMPNGNIIYLGWERLDENQQIAFGRKPSDVSRPYLWGEFVQEIKPIGSSDYEVVWEWRLKDHFVQDYDPTKSNYGEISDEIGKVDINYLGPTHFSDDDWWHCNALDYNEKLDHILVNSRSNGELWIIDHSTTMEEAAGSTGGNSGKGGELIYRWGNPKAYNSGSLADLRMYGSHGHYWIPDGLPNAGKIMYFNNGDERPGGYYSTVEIIDPQFENGAYPLQVNKRYLPQEPEVVYQAPDPFDFRSTYLSNAQQLANGNIFINEGGTGRLFEVDSEGNIVWQYLNPVDNSGPNMQGEPMSNWRRQIFRAYKYAPDYPGFDGVSLTPGMLLEGDSEYYLCRDNSTSEGEVTDLNISYDLVTSILSVQNRVGTPSILQVYTIDGLQVLSKKLTAEQETVALRQLRAGIYVAMVSSLDGKSRLAKKLVRI